MKAIKSWRVEWAVGGLFLLPFALAKSPLRSSMVDNASACHVRHAGIAERKAHTPVSSRRRYRTRNVSTAMSEWENESSFIKRSSRVPSEPPRLPEYPFNGRRDRFPDAQPHVTEPDSDLDSFWERHSPSFDENEREVPHENHEKDLLHSPVVYQYFGRSRSRVHTADSIPFILLGPTVDHWKTVGQTLASRGFSVMACEIVEEPDQPEQGKNLILAVLDALRWNRAILVGCDSKAALAIEAAIQLAPDRVKGLVLCGDLSQADQLARRAAAVDTERLRKFTNKEDEKRHIALDSLLNTYLECPYTLVWDGDVAQAPKTFGDTSNMNSGDMFRFNRCLILGGGTAPHRRRPEQFAWALTRFVEEKVAPRSIPLQIHAADTGNSQNNRHGMMWRFNVFAAFENLFSQGSLLVTGRVVASVIFYITAMKIAVHQYESLRGGVVSINSLVQCINSSKQRVCGNVGAFIRNYGYIFSLFSRKRSTGKELEVYKEVDADGLDSPEAENPGENQSEEEEEPKVETDEEDVERDEVETPESESKNDDEPPKRLMLLDLVVV